jgi:hypothetical protein
MVMVDYSHMNDWKGIEQKEPGIISVVIFKIAGNGTNEFRERICVQWDSRL